MIFKTFKKLTRVPCPYIIVLAIVQDRERPCETVQDRARSYDTVYIQPHMKSTSRVSSTVSISYINRIESNSEQKSVGPYVNPVNVQVIE